MCGSIGVGVDAGVGVSEGGSRVCVCVWGRVWEIFWRYRFCWVLGVKCVRVRVRVRAVGWVWVRLFVVGWRWS